MNDRYTVLTEPKSRERGSEEGIEGLLRTFNLVGLERTPDSHNGSMRERERERYTNTVRVIDLGARFC